MQCDSTATLKLEFLEQGILDGEVIAVRRLFRLHGIDMNHFRNEVDILMKLRHPNIVNLLGYCSEVEETVVEYQGKLVRAENSEQLLCYEYLPIGSIDKYIFGMMTHLMQLSPYCS